jgi:hypothetical protein
MEYDFHSALTEAKSLANRNWSTIWNTISLKQYPNQDWLPVQLMSELPDYMTWDYGLLHVKQNYSESNP